MKIIRSLNAVDSHTMGEPTRIVTGGIPNIPGKTMAEKRAYLENKMDYIRTAIMLEPRGHENMFGSILVAPVNEEADFGIIFMDGGGYLNMCGHGSIGASTVAVETGIVEATEPYTYLKLDTPAGLIETKVKVENGKAKEATIKNVPSFLYKRDVKINVPEIGELTIDISFGGSFFILVKASELGVDIDPNNSQILSSKAMKIMDYVNKNIEIEHPILKHIKTADLVEIYGPPKNPKATLQNVVVFGKGQIDRSPCGTGTSAKIATLVEKGQLKLGEEFVYESILGTMFRGVAVEETKVGEFNAVIPEITGSAYITGFNNFVIDEEDPVKHGFLLK